MLCRISADGSVYRGETYDDIVMEMSEEKFEDPHSLSSYRKATSKRIHSIYGTEVDPSSSKSFVESLIEVGLMEKLDENSQGEAI